MGRVLHYGGPFAGASVSGPKAFIATPSYGDVSPAYTAAMVQSSAFLTKEGIAFEYELYTGNCHVDDSRNRMVRDFLCSDCTEFVFIDADVRFEPNDLAKLIRCDKDVIAGIYPLKQYNEDFPVRHLDSKEPDENGFIEVESVPTGFLKIKRHVLEKMAANSIKFPSRDDVGKKPKIPIIFERTFKDNTRWGGDYTFCWKWRSMGGKIFIDPSFLFEHYGESCWSGIYSAFLMKTSDNGLPDAMRRIRDGLETEQDIVDLVHAWRNVNGWQVSSVLLKALILLAREADGPILECGSGLSTICMAAAAKHDIYVLEHDEIFAAAIRENIEKLGITNVKLIYAPLKDFGEYEWYGVNEYLPEMSMIFCDGPPRSTKGHRAGIERVADRLRPGGVMVFDDYDTRKIKAIIGALDLQERMINEDGRPFYIGTRNGVVA